MLFFAILLGAIGIQRFLFVKEEVSMGAGSAKITPKGIVKLLKGNRYVLCLAIMLIFSNLIGGLGVNTYYYLYIVGDVSIMGIMSLFTVVSMLTMAVYPKLLRKISPKNWS